MRTLVIVAGLVSCLGLTACEQSKSQATETAPAPVKKSLSRMAPLYAGQEQIQSVETATVERNKGGDGLLLKAEGTTPTPGYYQLMLLPRINAAPPPDGVYDVDVIGYKPQTPTAPQAAKVEANGDWTPYPKERLKGVRFIAKNNEKVVMLPPA